MKQASYLILGGLPWLVNWAPSSSTTNWNQLPQQWGENDPCNWNSKWGFVENIFFHLVTFCMSLVKKPFHKMVPSRSGATWLVVWHNHRVWISIQISETLQQSLFAVQLWKEIASTLRKGWIYPPSFCTWLGSSVRELLVVKDPDWIWQVRQIQYNAIYTNTIQCNLDKYKTMKVGQIQYI